MTETQAPAKCRLVEWKRFPNAGALVGKATIEFPGGWIVSNIPVFKKQDGGYSAGGPDAPIVDREGRHATDDRGKRRYVKIITFKNDAAKARWEQMVLDCVTGDIS